MFENFSRLEKKINFKFKNRDLLIQAFAHKSYLNENPDFYLGDNERLEFLGDAVLELVITEYLYKNFPKKREGELTNFRAALVNTKMLLKVAQDIGLENFILLSRGEARDQKKGKKYILADIFEALVGAIYLDAGYEASTSFIEKHLIKELPRIEKEGLLKDDKSEFQEKAQKETGITPSYEVLDESGPDHLKSFVIGVFLEDKLIAKGEGDSKQEGEERAAGKALEVKNW